MSASCPIGLVAGGIAELLEFVELNSPFYADLWNKSEGNKSLGDLPIVDHASFWECNTCLDSKVLTAKQKDGIIFKTGGRKNTSAWSRNNTDFVKARRPTPRSHSTAMTNSGAWQNSWPSVYAGVA